MASAELRGFEWAGLKLAIEVPRGVDPESHWDLPGGFVPTDDGCDADIRVSVTEHPHSSEAVASSSAVACFHSGVTYFHSGVTYFHEGDVFEVGRLESDHWIRLAADGRIALADSTFRFVEVALSAESSRERFPLARPLDDLVLIHRALAKGAFALRATAAVQDGRALLMLGDVASGWPPGHTEIWQGWLLLQPHERGVQVAPLPSTMRSGRAGSDHGNAWLEGLHVLDPMIGGGDVVRVLDPDAAAGELLRYAFASIAGANDSDRLVETATQIAQRVAVVQFGSSCRQRFAWQPGHWASRSALPAGA